MCGFVELKSIIYLWKSCIVEKEKREFACYLNILETDSNHMISKTKMTIAKIISLVTILVYHSREKQLQK